MPGPVFHLEPAGRLANQMIEYMVALTFAEMVGGCRISNIRMPEWGIDHAAIEPEGAVARERRQHHIDLPALADAVRSGRIARVEWTGFGQRMENLLPRERYEGVFRSPFAQPMGFGPGHLVCPVRAEDILHGPNPDYVLTPVEYYRDIVATSGLTPVFIGQTEPNSYMDRLVAAFPDAVVRPPQADTLVDFETIRQSRHVALCVSTYAWLAAWLSRSLETIHMPVSGLYNPMQKSNVDLLPIGDERYHFTLFPINHAVKLDQHAQVHERIAPFCRRMPHDALRRQFQGAPRFERRLADALAVFDASYYLASNGDVAAAAGGNAADFALDHYRRHGFNERRLPMRIDPVWYATSYPMAAFEVAQGDYAEFAHHYVAVGKARGYLPCPPEAEAVGR